MDQYILKSGNPLECAIILFYISNEGISVLENIAHLGVPIPSFLRKTLAGVAGDDATDISKSQRDTTPSDKTDE